MEKTMQKGPELVKSKKRLGIYDMVTVGIMAAVVFVITFFIKGEIPTPAGPVMFKLANAFCLLAGILFGGLRGGLAAGIGSMLFDLLDPKYIADAPFTFIRFFLMAFICGIICFAGKRKGKNFKWNLFGATAGSLFSLTFYFFYSLIKQLIQAQPLNIALANISLKMLAGSVNAVLAIIIAFLIAFPCRAALQRAGYYQKLTI